MKIKKILAIVIVLALLSSTMTPFALAATVSHKDTIISCGNLVIEEGGTATLDVNITNNMGFVDALVILDIDNELFTVDSITRGSVTESANFITNRNEFNNGTSDTLRVTIFHTGTNWEDDGSIFQVKLTAKSDKIAGTYPIGLSYDDKQTHHDNSNDLSVLDFSYIKDIQCVGASIIVNHAWDEGTSTPSACVEGKNDTLYTCTVCDETYIEPSADAHVWNNGRVTEATCTTDGNTTYTCTLCDITMVTDIIPAEHSYGNWLPYNDNMHRHSCSVCRNTETAKHNMVDTVVEPTCTAPGSVTSTCSDCGYSTYEEIPASDHSFDPWINAGKDYHIHYCSVCDDFETQDHIFTETVTEPTCTAGGYTTFVCTVCNYVTRGNETEPTPHNYKAVVTEPTCVAKGYTTYTCSVCNNSYTGDETDTIPHSYTFTITPPTCVDQGYTTHTCSVCEHNYKDNYVDATGEHSYESVVTEPTCVDQGYTTYTCSVCEHNYKDNYVDATGEHSYESVVTEPTCGEQGYTTYTCSVCEHSYKDNYVDATGEHSYESVITEPTCTEAGFTTHTCSVCGNSYTDNEIEAAGHEYESTVIEPTDKEGGYTLHECKNCDDSYKDNFTDPMTESTVKGDANGNFSVNNDDLVMVAQYIVNLIDSLPYMANVDMNNDGLVNNADLVAIAIIIIS